MLTQTQLHNNSLDEYWCVPNNGTQLFKDTVIAYLKERYKITLTGESDNGILYGYDGSKDSTDFVKRGIEYFKNNPTIYTLPEFIEKLNTSKNMKADQLEYAIANALLTKNNMTIEQLKIENEKLKSDIAKIKATEQPQPAPLTLDDVYNEVKPKYYSSLTGEITKLSGGNSDMTCVPTEHIERKYILLRMLENCAEYFNGKCETVSNVWYFPVIFNNQKNKTTSRKGKDVLPSFKRECDLQQSMDMIDAKFGKDYVLNVLRG